jgi:glyoxylase-like metal-dependent hydrolase (beta-lactamase superfamily II)
MPLHYSFTLGRLRCHLLEAGKQRLDGGAMFGVVPKTLWSRRIAPDDRNRIPMVMRCLLIEHPAGLVLIDSGLGDKEDPKFLEIYGVENEGDPGPTLLEDAMREAGHRPEDVRWVINTHLHFDHAGGNVVLAKAEGAEKAEAAGGTSASPASPASPDVPPYRLGFPNATYVVQKGELEFARHANERTRASYLPHNYEPVAQAGRWNLVEGDVEVLPGISTRLTPGHVPWHQSIVIASGGETAVFVADLIPTSAHLPLVYIMGYDVEPLRTLETKRAFYRDALAGDWRLIFEHDVQVAMGRLVPDGKGVGLAEVVPGLSG